MCASARAARVVATAVHVVFVVVVGKWGLLGTVVDLRGERCKVVVVIIIAVVWPKPSAMKNVNKNSYTHKSNIVICSTTTRHETWDLEETGTEVQTG